MWVNFTKGSSIKGTDLEKLITADANRLEGEQE